MRNFRPRMGMAEVVVRLTKEKRKLAESVTRYRARIAELEERIASLSSEPATQAKNRSSGKPVEVRPVDGVSDTYTDASSDEVDQDSFDDSSDESYSPSSDESADDDALHMQTRGMKRKWSDVDSEDETSDDEPRHKQFSYRPKILAEELIGLPENYDNMDIFNVGKSSIKKYKAFEYILNALLILYQVLPLHKLNEAGRSAFITLVLGLAVINFSDDAVIEPQYRLQRCDIGRGIPDWVIKLAGRIILVVEAKTRDVKKGITQNVLQLYAAYREMWPSDDEQWRTMYGVVSTAEEWILLEVQFKGKECKIRRGHTNLKLPFNDKNLDKKMFATRLELLIEHLTWLLSNRQKLTTFVL
jgi:hypothetical protein